jgi:hypothetical protein
MTNETILFWESEADLQGGKSPCVAKITAFNEGSDLRMGKRIRIYTIRYRIKCSCSSGCPGFRRSDVVHKKGVCDSKMCPIYLSLRCPYCRMFWIRGPTYKFDTNLTHSFPLSSYCTSLSGTSGCESSTIGLFPSIFATIEGTCDDSGDEMQAEVEWVQLLQRFP